MAKPLSVVFGSLTVAILIVTLAVLSQQKQEKHREDTTSPVPATPILPSRETRLNELSELKDEVLIMWPDTNSGGRNMLLAAKRVRPKLIQMISMQRELGLEASTNLIELLDENEDLARSMIAAGR